MKIVDLKKDMDAQFTGVSARFASVDARFDAVDARFDAVDARFDGIDARFGAVDARSDEMAARMQAQYETTRRHIDIWGEQLRTEMRLYAEQSAAMLKRFDAMLAANAQDHANFMRIFENHEVRITSLEPKST